VVAIGAKITLTEPGVFNLTCLVNSSYNGIDCSETLFVQGLVTLGLLHIAQLYVGHLDEIYIHL